MVLPVDVKSGAFDNFGYNLDKIVVQEDWFVNPSLLEHINFKHANTQEIDPPWEP